MPVSEETTPARGLSRDGSRARLERFRTELGDGVEAAVISRPEHLLYLANFFPDPTSLNLHGDAYLVVEREGPATLITDNWLGGRMAPDPRPTTSADEVITRTWYDGKSPARPRGELLASAVIEFLVDSRTTPVRAIAAEASFLPHTIGARFESVVDCEPRLRSMREIKDPDEIEAIRRGVACAEAVHAASRGALEPGITEIEYYARLLAAATESTGCPFVMMCDLISGARAAEGRGPPSATKQLEEGELVILDIFPYVDGYRGDITNTLVVGGEPSEAQVSLFELVHGALGKAESMLAPGVPTAEIARAIDTHLGTAGESLASHAGHAIGLGHPESPEVVLTPADPERVLEEGMVIAIEPGVYGKPDAPIRGGLRLEHDYRITASGFERLSSHRLGLD